MQAIPLCPMQLCSFSFSGDGGAWRNNLPSTMLRLDLLHHCLAEFVVRMNCSSMVHFGRMLILTVPDSSVASFTWKRSSSDCSLASNLLQYLQLSLKQRHLDRESTCIRVLGFWSVLNILLNEVDQSSCMSALLDCESSTAT